MAKAAYEEKEKLSLISPQAVIDNILNAKAQQNSASPFHIISPGREKVSDILRFLTQTEEDQVLIDLHRSAWRRPRTLCSSGLCLPQQRERRGSHKRSGCARRPPRLPSWASRPRLSPQTPSLRCWQTHYAARCDSRSCESPLTTEREMERRLVVATGCSPQLSEVNINCIRLCLNIL